MFGNGCLGMGVWEWVCGNGNVGMGVWEWDGPLPSPAEVVALFGFHADEEVLAGGILEHSVDPIVLALDLKV